MRRKYFFVSVLGVLGLMVIVFLWSASQSEIMVTYPQPNDVVDYNFVVAGTVPVSWLKDSRFSANIFIEDKSHFLYGESILGQSISVEVSWWKKIVGGSVDFHDELDTGGFYGDGVYEGPATLVLSSYANMGSISIPIYMDLEKF